jgi:high-affinity Fe2+/Pb2+ permease
MWRIVFWVAALGVIATYTFFFVLGAFSFTDSMIVSGLVIILALAWIVHGWLENRHRHASDLRDPRLIHARERRGF